MIKDALWLRPRREGFFFCSAVLEYLSLMCPCYHAGPLGWKRSGKILGNSGSVFSYFLVIFVLFGKYGNQYENEIWCHEIRLDFHTVRFLIGRKNPVIFWIYSEFFTLFIWVFPHCSSGLACYLFFILIKRFFKYSNDSNLQNKKSVLK
jgi:hypothetical protein